MTLNRLSLKQIWSFYCFIEKVFDNRIINTCHHINHIINASGMSSINIPQNICQAGDMINLRGCSVRVTSISVFFNNTAAQVSHKKKKPQCLLLQHKDLAEVGGSIFFLKKKGLIDK